ncbi:alcohol dehydrogenase class-3-like [Dermacentor variabilis]|uniref:alcohol dehydrogenase class-3-like n=1 Tax=Dermacentor variabilis TaxID=34621 RepID=UPI003F5B95A8
MSMDPIDATQGMPIYCRAAVAWEPSEPLSIETVEVGLPRQGEVRVKILHTGTCHADSNTLEGLDPERVFPCILGHEGAGIVESVGPKVTRFKPGDHVIPLSTPQCKECRYCKNPRTNLCSKIRTTQGRGLMPDGTTRFMCQGHRIYHFMGTSTFSEYTVVSEYSLCKINIAAPLDKVWLLACAVSRGYGAALNAVKITKENKVGIWGLGAVGLSVAMGAKERGAKSIIGIDINESKFQRAKEFGCTECINPNTLSKSVVQHLAEKTNGGLDFTFECIGNVHTMREALESTHAGWGESIILGAAPTDKLIATLPSQLTAGRTWRGCVFGGWKTVDQVPQLVDLYLDKKLKLDELISHRLHLERINDAFTLMQGGLSIRTVISF